MKFGRKRLLSLAVALTGILSSSLPAQDAGPEPPSAPITPAVAKRVDAKSVDADWDAIRSSAEKYLSAYNSGDAQAIAALFTDDAELVDSSGTVYRGRKIIAEEFAAFFKARPQAKLRVVVDNVTFVSPSVAMEDGTTESRLSEDQPPVTSRYVAVHVKEKNGWRLASVRDEAVPVDGRGNLSQLTWMIGRWIDEGSESQMEIDCYWHDGGAFLMRDFKLKIEGLLASHGTERIGWDPRSQQIRSWLFDADGGYLEGSWVHNVEHWTVTTKGFRADGEPIRATYVVTPLRDNAYHMASFNRAAGDENLDDFEMTIVRRPPPAGEATTLRSKPVKDVKDSSPQPTQD